MHDARIIVKAGIDLREFRQRAHQGADQERQ
jgi:hypothetical protein